MIDVLLDARVVERGQTGIARYVHELARRIPDVAPIELTAIVTRADPRLPGAKSMLRVRSPFLNPTELAELPLRIAMRRGVFWVPAFNAPPLARKPFVMTIHDANHLALPGNYSRAHALYYRTVVRASSLRANAVITVSEFARRELIERIGVPEAKIRVIPNGVVAPQAPARELIERVRAKFGLPASYVSYIGNFKAHKNVGVLLRAARKDTAFVLVGGTEAELGGDLRDARLRGARVHVLRPLPDEDLWPVIAGASVFAFPSRYEGFGLPPLEAMSLGVPVVASTAPALREVTGDAALLVDPDDAQGFAKAIEDVVSDNALAESLVLKGYERARLYTWDNSAREHARVLMEAAQ